jgi:cytochrome c oxidase subunit II
MIGFVFAAGADFAQSALDPAGPQAARIGHLWWLLLWVTTAVFLLVLAALAAALVSRRRGPGDRAAHTAPIVHPEPAGERRRFRAVAAAAGATVLILFGLLVASVATGREIASLHTGPGEPTLTLDVVGHQWWWEVEYQDRDPSRAFVTANEIHLPVGRPVLIKAASRDVIHSLWIPNLHGKRDLIPGRTNALWLEADRPGIYRGQCAEFCGYQHAHMALDVIAEPADRFAAWVEAQRQPAAAPASALAQRGRAVFQALPCPLCHTVSGTGANGMNGPDLTHLASRRTIAAGALPNTRGALAGWILDPASAKPGTKMPATRLDPDDLEALLAYLESLQ